MDVWTAILAVYAAGVLVALTLAHEPFPARLGVAALWPLGPISFVVVIATLLLALPVAMPRAALALAGAILAFGFLWIWIA